MKPSLAIKPTVASIVSLCVALSMICTACHDPGATTRSSVILITLDTTRADALGIYGRNPSPSPNLDAFAAEATVYERAYAPSSWTLPTHSSLFTGLLPSQHGAGTLAPTGDPQWHVRPLASEFMTLAEILVARGYRTAAVIGGPALARELGVAQGFEEYDADFSRTADRWHGKRAQYVATRALDLIEGFGSDPYFLFLNFFDPHRPYAPPPGRYARRLPPEKPNMFDAELLLRLGTPAVDSSKLPESLRAKLDASRTRYHAEVSYMDEQLARMLRAVDARPDGERPIIVITSDHGESFGEHNFSLHGFHLYEDNVHVPLLIRWPNGRDGGRRVEQPVETHRVFALILRELGIDPPEEADAAPLESTEAPIITQTSRTEMGIELFGKTVDRDLTAIYTHPYKLIASSSGQVELFDLERDPLELHDLAASDPERAREMRSELDAFLGDRARVLVEDSGAELSEDTSEALRALGYIE